MLIGICGDMGSGKSTLAKLIIKDRPEYKIYSFASPIKEMLYHCGLDNSYSIDKTKVTPFGVTYRKMMQTLGTEWGRKKINKDMWIIVMENKLIGKTSQDNVNDINHFWINNNYVIDDVRFENEFKYIIKNNGIVFRIWRHGPSLFSKWKFRFHSSEREWSKFEIPYENEVLNYGSIDSLERYVSSSIKSKIIDAEIRGTLHDLSNVD